jgi:uncharacterized protein YdhG (YjbR/CyaY superfamily)
MTYEATTVDEYVAQIPEDRREAFTRLLEAARANLPKGFEECMSYGMPSFAVPHSIYPAGYHCKPDEPLPFLAIGNQKGHISFYHSGVYTDPDLLAWFESEWAKRDIGKLDMGKSCIRFRKMDRIPYDLLGKLCTKITVDEWVRRYEERIKPA